MDSELMQLGDPVVYRDEFLGMDEIGVITNSCLENFKVLWNDEMKSKVENPRQLRKARSEEVVAQCRQVNTNETT
ncbi:phosphohistidine phosphatase [Acinetobacter junii]|uniref:phosphohistidine phosphatase n=1 Tax=Acinetobacter junii TaxID=40215 RepID=UPI0022EAC92B|nr:phosphohistidine phosphatase [Acinetobacter junii]MDA3507328.1 phosphohistidine phosphatase [Acinetobacter junii]MDA3531998.1 phosphohistidine phosphatase [Acinetobacter junii]